jgi:hypothetical protein
MLYDGTDRMGGFLRATCDAVTSPLSKIPTAGRYLGQREGIEEVGGFHFRQLNNLLMFNNITTVQSYSFSPNLFNTMLPVVLLSFFILCRPETKEK